MEAQNGRHRRDELAEATYGGSKASDGVSGAAGTRHVNLILDHSAFVRGIGNLKRWFNSDFVNESLRTGDTRVVLTLYIPLYTLHEFNFVKKGTSILATNAREAIRFIDEHIGAMDVDTASRLGYDFQIELKDDRAPSWGECSRFQVHRPTVGEFPNYKTKFDSNLLGHHSSGFGGRGSENNIHFENSSSYQQAAANCAQEAAMPLRLRYLLRSCIYKRFMDQLASQTPSETWKLVTEDSITRVWAQSFGIDALNVNEAEWLIFEARDTTSFRNYDAAHNFLAANDDFHEEADKRTLQKTVDTTKYAYSDALAGKTKKKGRRKKFKGQATESVQTASGETVVKERFDAINFAPRGKGQLWKPS